MPALSGRATSAIPKTRSFCSYYPDRTAWLLEPDATPPKLSPYHAEETPKPPPAATAPPLHKTPPLRFEQVK